MSQLVCVHKACRRTEKPEIPTDCGRVVRGVYQSGPTTLGQFMVGTLLRDDATPHIAWLLAEDATIYPVSRQSLSHLDGRAVDHSDND